MPSILHELPRTVLEELGRALSAGRIQPPYSGIAVREWVTGQEQRQVCEELERLRAFGMSPTQIGVLMDMLTTERTRQQTEHDRIQMVWTGPDQEGPATRDTSVVARELLSQAEESLLITTFSVSRDSTTFVPVSEAMQRNPSLDVTLILNVEMARLNLYGAAAASAFAKEFWATKWPWPHRPKVYFDPRGTAENSMDRALQHSKCIVADRRRVLITSANYTESGQLRNIELGVLIHDDRLAARVAGQFKNLISEGLLRSLT